MREVLESIFAPAKEYRSASLAKEEYIREHFVKRVARLVENSYHVDTL